MLSAMLPRSGPAVLGAGGEFARQRRESGDDVGGALGDVDGALRAR